MAMAMRWLMASSPCGHGSDAWASSTGATPTGILPGRAAAVNLGDWREGVAQVETVTLKAPRHVSHILRRLHGITPIKAMAHALKARGAPFSLRLLGVDLSRIQFESFI
jgi:hypothetical protein